MGLTQNRTNLLGEIIDDKMHLNDAGQMVTRWYWHLENKFSRIKCDEFICMPNHAHFILLTTDSENQGEHVGSPLHKAVQWFKTMTTNDYIREVRVSAWPPFEKKLWQRNYWERVIRNESELIKIQTYIQSNPLQWREDSLFAE